MADILTCETVFRIVLLLLFSFAENKTNKDTESVEGQHGDCNDALSDRVRRGSDDCGNDEDMLRGEPKAVVVGNFSPELIKLKGLKNIYFSKNGYAAGIIEALEKYRFLKSANRN